MDAKYLEAHRALGRKIAEVNADARKLLASGAKLDRVVKLVGEAETIVTARTDGIEEHLEKQKTSRAQATTEVLTREQLIAEFSKLDAKGLKKTKETIEAALKENPERADAKLALEAINEVTAKAAK